MSWNKGEAVAESSKVLVLREKLTENIEKIHGSPPALGKLKKIELEQTQAQAREPRLNAELTLT